ncbi:MAG: helix-turn-helix domain-containing protein [Leptospirillia bacterium]
MTTPTTLAALTAPDWHPADIVAALRKVGTSLRKLSIANGYAPHTVKAALNKPYPNGERIIADALGVHPMEIWPSRYTDEGKPIRKTAHKITRMGYNSLVKVTT